MEGGGGLEAEAEADAAVFISSSQEPFLPDSFLNLPHLKM
jgi:hypothetical protein